MFDVEAKDIAQLDDEALRQLVGLLCEAELARSGKSTSVVTYGGDQKAKDDGVDVRVRFASGDLIDGFLPRRSIVFQVKTPQMGPAEIAKEMRPGDAICPAIAELAEESGAYIIVSSRSSVSDAALRARTRAMRAALSDVPSGDAIHLDFYDRTRIATWVRSHAGAIAWVRARIGGALSGWRPYGRWSGGIAKPDEPYFLDDTPRLRTRNDEESPPQSAAEGIDRLRDSPAPERAIVRLVGLSGVGKTRLAEALFDARLGSRPLPQSLAVYTDLSNDPNPQPIGLASELIARRTRAIMIVDNCSPELHQALSATCRSSESRLSVLTIEYDVRDDQPEGTDVFTLEAGSEAIVRKLIQDRYAHLSPVDARTIAEAAGGNARVAIALAQTVGRGETISGLPDEALFQRLFHQRHERDKGLLAAAAACSLVYSFDGEAIDDDASELRQLAALSEQTPAEMHRHVSELLRRQLAQRRGKWRAILPHAIANRLAARALEDIPPATIDRRLDLRHGGRLAQSFSRRLTYLYRSASARLIAERWLAPDGLLGDPASLDETGSKMFANAASVLPEAALNALERVGESSSDRALATWRRHGKLLCSIAYDPAIFARSVELLVQLAAEDAAAGSRTSDSVDLFLSLFMIFLSGVHATASDRLAVINRLLHSVKRVEQLLGLRALAKMLHAGLFTAARNFEFGARSRDYGYHPKQPDEIAAWYRTALTFIDELCRSRPSLKTDLQRLLADAFRGLWTRAGASEQLDAIARQFVAEEFWSDGWAACRMTLRFDAKKLPAESVSRLRALETALRPNGLHEEVRAYVLISRSASFAFDLADDEDISAAMRKLEQKADDLGALVAADPAALTDLAPDLLRGGVRAFSFGRGLYRGSADAGATWSELLNKFELIPKDERDLQLVCGFLAGSWALDPEIAHGFLDKAFEHQALIESFPILQATVPLDARSVQRLRRALSEGMAPASAYRLLGFAPEFERCPGAEVEAIVVSIAKLPDGFSPAASVLCALLHKFRQDGFHPPPEILRAGRRLLPMCRFGQRDTDTLVSLPEMARICLADPEGGSVAAEIASKLSAAIAQHKTIASENFGLLKALLEAQPLAVLDALFAREDDWKAGEDVFDCWVDGEPNPADVIPTAVLLAWCGQQPLVRYELAARFVSFRLGSKTDDSVTWTEQALTLLRNAPNSQDVLTTFLRRFEPSSGWFGSCSAIIEKNARLLESLEALLPGAFAASVADASRHLAQRVASVRQWANDRDRNRDERFE